MSMRISPSSDYNAESQEADKGQIRVEHYSEPSAQWLLEQETSERNRPLPSLGYQIQAHQDPTWLTQPKALLVLIDMNGTLICRQQRGASNHFIERPYVKEFLRYLFKFHRVMVWGSARPRNLRAICSRLLNREQLDSLVAMWGRDTLRLPTSLYNRKAVIHKRLEWVWDDESIRAQSALFGHPWDQSNTVLIDDSLDKAASEPFNLIQVESFVAAEHQTEDEVLPRVVRYLEYLRLQKDASAYIRASPFGMTPES